MNFKYNKKNVTFSYKDKKFYLNDENLLNVNVYLTPASLTKEFAYLCIKLNVPLMQKKYGNCIFLRSDTWLKKQTDEENDAIIVDNMNNKIYDICPMTLLSMNIEATPGEKMEKTDVFIQDKQLICPELNFYFNFENVDVVFYQRFTSYTRTFDLTFVLKNKKRMDLSLIDRKKYMKELDQYFKENNMEVVKTGPDPINWHEAYEKHYKNNLDWSNVYKLDSETEEEEDEWVEGETDDEELSDDYIYSSEDEVSVDLSESKKRKLDEEWEKKGKVLDSDDYDRWEKKQKV